MTGRDAVVDVQVVAGTPGAAPGGVPGGATRSRKRRPWWLWAAALAVLLPVALPIVFLFARAFGATEAAWDTLLSMRTLRLAVRSFVFTGLVTASAVTIGVAGAWLLARTDIALKRVWGVAFALPLVIPSYVLALAFLSGTGPRGVFAEFTGLPIPHLVGFPGAWMALTITTYPYVYLITTAAMTRIDPALEEAARGLGASPVRVFRTVILPQLRPAIGAGALLAALYTLSDFGAVSLMRFDAFTRVIYAQYSGRLDRTPAIVLSIVLIMIAGVIIWGEQRTRGKGRYFSRSASRPPSTYHLRRGQRWTATLGLAVVVLVGVVIPVTVLATWIARSLAAGSDITIPLRALTGSLTAGTLAAAFAMVAAIPITVLSVRYASKSTRWLERGVFTIFSLPHITIAIAVVAFTIRYAQPVYQSILVLTLVYAAMFLAQATSSAKASLLQVNPALEDASRSLGRGPITTYFKVTFPLMARGLMAGGALVFVTTIKELPATLLLSPPGFTTLAVRIWAAADELLYARAATASLLLIAVSVIPVYYLSIRSKDVVHT
ncbi:MAG: iron ABC transporter permease [Acidimicrobiia bacterium]|nr:MAG: iron ABC transporter permease [Acidimicrobiia bacterium]